MMKVETTPWYETRSLISPRIEMLQEEGMILYKKSFLKSESPKTANLKPRFVHYDANYISYCFLKEFYQLLFDGAKKQEFSASDLVGLLAEVTEDFLDDCSSHTLEEEDAKHLFQVFCQTSLFG
ncbi:hypothetical protein [Microcoleus sp. D2_18a_B4]|uniref:hypothetical protein n=1 Tax=Microcoleus sp. D2_18a_B4 TaxID=3055329 RepID=UPI002FD28412